MVRRVVYRLQVRKGDRWETVRESPLFKGWSEAYYWLLARPFVVGLQAWRIRPATAAERKRLAA